MEYRKLDRRTGEIRLLRLPPHESSDTDEALQCSVEHESLALSPSYVALSYPWGDSKETEPIVVDGRRFSVTLNLASALRSLWQIGVERVWADRICINQHDDEELDAQIPRMEAIFRTASVTHAWIPLGRDDCRAVERWIGHASRPDAGHMSDALGPLEPFLTNSYWHRIWVLQELALSRTIRITYGTVQFSFEEMKHLVMQICSDESAEMFTALSVRPSVESGLQHLLDLINLRDSTQSINPLRLIYVLEITRESDATKPKDRLYGIWGLAADAHRYLSDQSYTFSAHELCVRLTRAHIELSESLDILPTLALSSADPDLPSWAPNWFLKETWRSLVNPQNLLPSRVPGLKHVKTSRSDDRVLSRRFRASQQANGGTRYRGFAPWPYPVPWSAHAQTPARCLPEGGEANVLRTRGLLLGTIDSQSTGLDESSHGSAGSRPPRSPSPVTPVVSVRQSNHVRTPLGLSRALFFLMTLSHAHEAPRNEKIFEWSSVRISRWLPFRKDMGGGFIQPFAFGDLISLQGQLNNAAGWVKQNSDFEIFDVKMSSILRVRSASALIAVRVSIWVLCFCLSLVPIIVWIFSKSDSIIFRLVSLILATVTALCAFVLLTSLAVDAYGSCRRWISEPTATRLSEILRLKMRLAWGDFGVGWVHAKAQEGDSIAILMGCSVPLVLRPRPDGNGWVLVGDAIVFGAMEGELMDETECEHIEIH